MSDHGSLQAGLEQESVYGSLQAGLEQERQSMDLYDRNIDEVDNNEQRQASADY